MQAFDRLVPLDDGYARRPIDQAFDWAAVANELRPGHEWYLVAFRSVRRADADEDRLNQYDERAHLEAAGAPGFVHYFKGPRSTDGSCLSFCLWDSRPTARAAAGLPAHREAVTLIDEMYERYVLEFHRVSRSPTAPGLTFAPYDRAATAA